MTFMMSYFRTLTATFLLGMVACQDQNTTEQTMQIPIGDWRAELTISGGQILPFQMSAEQTPAGLRLYILNADERLMLDEFVQKGDSLHIPMHIFDSEIIVKVSEDQLNGRWVRYNTGTHYSLPFQALKGKRHRFEEKPSAATADITGRWETDFDPESEKPEKALGVFEQDGNRVKGTFLTATGDYRYLEGQIEANILKMSCFDGSHAYLFRAELENGALINGEFWAGKSGYVRWKAQKNEGFQLPNPETLTFLKPGYDRLSFSFPNLEGQTVSLTDPAFQGKVVVVQLLGSWCPNCMDETAFLAPFYKKYKDKGLEVVGLAYENSADPAVSRVRLEKLQKRFDIQYALLFAGVRDKAEAAKTLPMLNHVMAFPTTIIIDRKGQVRKIHTGFSGPGTGKYYEAFTEEFTRFVEKLLAE